MHTSGAGAAGRAPAVETAARVTVATQGQSSAHAGTKQCPQKAEHGQLL